MRTRDKILLLLIVVLTALALMTLLWPAFGESLNRDELELGLDLEGGAHLVYEADFSELPEDTDPGDAMSGVMAVIEKRINAYGVSEPVIQKIGSDRLLIQIPGIDDLEEAKARIGETALIKFKEFVPFEPQDTTTAPKPSESGTSLFTPTEPENSGTPVQPDASGTSVEPNLSGTPSQSVDSGSPIYFAERYDEDEGRMVLTEVPRDEAEYKAIPATGTLDGKEIELTSQYFKGKVEVRAYSSTNQPELYFEWNETGAEIFHQITTRLSAKEEDSVERRLGIFVGDEYEDAPNVREPIRESGVITGLSYNEATHLQNFLNAGRIEVPLHTLEQHDVDPTLGENFVDWSIQAGVVGLLLIIFFLILYYRMPGLVAGIALLIYSVLVMAVYQLWPVTLTLAGIAGFILSIGMAVDANVLIFERMKEEIRSGRTLRAAVELGFNRAWPAIRDGNVSTLITCFILGFMGQKLGAPSVEGFAWTLGIGVLLSLFSAMVITRTFLRFLGTTGVVNQRALYISALKEKMLSGEGR
ncbi:MAG: protein translocase subunit SecD [Dehalococcoidia bacterium]